MKLASVQSSYAASSLRAGALASVYFRLFWSLLSRRWFLRLVYDPPVTAPGKATALFPVAGNFHVSDALKECELFARVLLCKA